MVLKAVNEELLVAWWKVVSIELIGFGQDITLFEQAFNQGFLLADNDLIQLYSLKPSMVD